MHNRLAQSLRALATALSIGCLAPAQAAVYTGQWDPAYGAPFDGNPALGWKGSAVFEVDDSCVALPQPVDLLSCPSFEVTSAEVVFYNDSAVGKPTVATLTFDGSSIDIFSAKFLTNGDLVWVDSEFSNPINPPETFLNINDYKFYLQFTTDGVRMYHTLVTGGVNNPGACPETDPAVCGYSGDVVEVTFQKVPEPGSLALVAAALGAGWAVRRLRQRG